MLQLRCNDCSNIARGMYVQHPQSKRNSRIHALSAKPVKMAARLDGVLLDPVYTGKAMAGLIALVRRGDFKKGERVLFVHTGGSPALYAYQKVLGA